MHARAPLHVTSPRAAAPTLLRSGAFPPSTIPARPMSASTPPTSSRPSPTSAGTTTPLRPKRPLSASRVQPATARPATPVGQLGTPPSPRRPASASRVRTTYPTSTLTRRVDEESEDDDVDTIAIPVARIQLEQPVEAPSTPTVAHPPPHEEPLSGHSVDGSLDRTAMADAEAFLRAWQSEEASFRSPLLFTEAAFAQAKAMASRGWPQPNVFLSSIAFGSLELFCKSLEHHHPFLVELVDTVGSALFANHKDLRHAQLHHMGHNDTSTSARMLRYMQQGQYCFQQLQQHEEQLSLSRRVAQSANQEVQRLNEQLQKQHVARLFERVQALVKSAATTAANTVPAASTANEMPYPQLRRMLFGDQRGARLDLQDDDYEFEPTTEEILLVFNSLRPHEATKLLRTMLAKACELELPQLAEMYATAVDMLPESERRKFLLEYFRLVESEELQDALRHRDETNRDKQWETFLADMKDVLRLDDDSQDKKAARFHSDEARVGASVYDLVDLVEEIATEVSLAEEKRPLKLSPELLARLKPYQSMKKRMEKATQLMMAVPAALPPLAESTACGCVCGKHRLVSVDEPANPNVQPRLDILRVDEIDGDELARKKKSSQKRSSVAGKSGKRKRAIVSVSARVSTRNSMASVQLFPLSEVCHLVSSVVQLQFAREFGDGAVVRRGSVRRNTRKSCDPALIQRPSFKALAKDLLTRKYGIKSIAVLHMLQMEKSLVHYSATDKHTRCELFAWFVGADKTRFHYKDLAFQFYLRVVKTVIAVVLKKPLDAVSYADLITGWTEQIGDADTSAGAISSKSLAGPLCIEVCNSVFPGWMKESVAFTLMIERLRVIPDSLDLEQFFKRVIQAWETQFINAHAQIREIFVREATSDLEELDLSLFSKCVRACGLDLTSGQLLEYYDNLLGNDDTGVALNKAVLLVIEQRNQS